MKIINLELLNMMNILNAFAEKKLPQKISYAITRNLILLQKDYDCYMKSLKKLFSDYDEYIIKDENGDMVSNDLGIPIVGSEVQKEFNEELSNLLNIEIEIEPYHIPENVFDYEDNVHCYDSLSAVDIINLQHVLCKQEKR